MYVHCGSWDGFSAGLLQPEDANKWQKGVFYKGKDGESINPILNKHMKDGNLVFNGYNQFLQSISDNLCFATITPQSLSHDEAKFFQGTGGKASTENASWSAGFAQAMHSPGSGRSVIAGSVNFATKLIGSTPDVNIVDGNNIVGFRQNFEDSNRVPKSEQSSEFWGVLSSLYEKDLLATKIPSTLGSRLSGYVEALLKGQPELQNESPLVTELDTFFTMAEVEKILANSDDLEGILTLSESYQRHLEKFKLAAALIETGIGQGMTIQLDGQDLHGGGASVLTARSGAMIFAQINLFWNWVKSKGLQDHVMVVVSHEFSRTPYNGTPGNNFTVKYKDANGAEQSAEFRAPGCDHQLVAGMVFLSGIVPPKSRVGGVGTLYTAMGSDDLKGIGNQDIAAYTSSELVGSMLLRFAPDRFPNPESLRKYWKSFRDPIDLLT